MQQMTQIMANVQETQSHEGSIPPDFKTQSMKAPDCFDRTQAFKVTRFIQSCQLIFHNYQLSNITNQDPVSLPNSWELCEYQPLALCGDPNEFRKTEAELDSVLIKEGGALSI
ncbi:hypothetical protein O181_131209 [Austropuccinia psidii MF-1]|uniref:Uncharacterized protein n=1 Tax=Austropuccinia psidii MF-1 TaxID=1389203 RepID=A0A9Q3L2H1_9BASI|nr:hypothetical protein [Austropuccinia psidii MF-1]